MWFRKATAYGIAVAAGLVVAACGSSSDSSDESSTASKEGTLDGGGKPFVLLTQGSSSAFTDSVKNSVGKAFEDKYNYNLHFDTSCCGLTKFEAMQKNDDVTYGAVSFANYGDYVAGKEKGYYEPLDPKIVPVDAMSPEGVDEYGVAFSNFAPILTWLKESYPEGSEPTSFADGFDSTKFPGKRCLLNSPQIGGTYEGALLAAGVAPDDLYPLDYDKAFGQLDTIKDDTVWFTDMAQAVQFLGNGTCKLAVLWNGVAQTTALSGTELGVAWKDAPISLTYIAVPKGSENPEAGQRFIGEYIGNQEALQKLLSKTAYPPLLKSLPLPESTQQWAPVGPNFDAGFVQDNDWYLNNTDEATKRLRNYVVTGKG
jgi:putative spermidine/putrescine transport system substrate-binding protein